MRLKIVLQRVRQSNLDLRTNLLNKDFHLFMDGLKIYNNYLRKKFGLAICKLERFYNYAKLSALSNDMVTQTESTMESLINILNKEDNNSPFEFLMELKSMMGEPSSTIKDIGEDLEVRA